MKHLYVTVNLEETGGHPIAVGDAIQAVIKQLSVLKDRAYREGLEAAELPRYGDIKDEEQDDTLIGEWEIKDRL